MNQNLKYFLIGLAGGAAAGGVAYLFIRAKLPEIVHDAAEAAKGEIGGLAGQAATGLIDAFRSFR